MKLRLLGLSALLLLLFFSGNWARSSWSSLLDKDLSQWDIYLSYRHQNGYKGDAPLDHNGDTLLPIGYKNSDGVFSMITEGREPVLRVSGEIYGCVFSRTSFANYHLKLKVKWGRKKWPPRLDEEMDSGILYHSQGKCGVDYWRSWMLAQEFQIIENSMGDYWNIANAQIQIKGVEYQGRNRYSQHGTVHSYGHASEKGNFCQSAEHTEKPSGEWNDIELICFADKSLHIVNGKVVMALSGSRYVENGKTLPLVSGKIQLQSEAAEVFYKDIRIRPLNSMPSQYKNYFE